MDTKERDAAGWEEHYATHTAAYQCALDAGDDRAADDALGQVVLGLEGLVRRIIAEASVREDDLANDCWVECVEVIIDHARRYRPGGNGPSFVSWVTMANGPLRNAIRRTIDEGRTGNCFSKGEHTILRVAGGARIDFVSAHGRAPSFEELRDMVAQRCDAWARGLVRDTKPHLTGFEFEAEVLHKLTKSGSAGALRNLAELLDVEQIRQVHPDGAEQGWEVVTEDSRTHVLDDTDAEVASVRTLSPMFALATAALNPRESAVLFERMDDGAMTQTELARRHAITGPAVKSILARSAATVAAPHAQFAFLTDTEELFEFSELFEPAGATSSCASFDAPVSSVGVGVVGALRSGSGAPVSGVGAMLARAAASLQQQSLVAA